MISPGIVGRLAERSLEENLDWAAQESQELVVTSQGYDRGWFSSEGQHRVELKDGGSLLAFTKGAGDAGDVTISTRDLAITTSSPER